MATETTLQAVFGGKAAARTLLFLENYGEGYARQIAKTFEMPVSEVQKQLNKFEEVGVLVSRAVGNARMYSWNPRDKALVNLRALLRETLENGIPEETLKRYYRDRQRPRRKGKR
ncbi:MAG: winged helix-turn-helix domain-containing protein [Nevskiales bacterium]